MDKDSMLARSTARYLAKVLGLDEAWSRVKDIARFAAGRSMAVTMAVTLLDHWDRVARPEPARIPDPVSSFDEENEHTIHGMPWRERQISPGDHVRG